MPESLSDQNWNTIILAVIGLVNTVVLALITAVGSYFIARINKGNTVVAAHVEEVKTALVQSDAKLDSELKGIRGTGEKTHTLVNGQMSVQMKISAVALRSLAEKTNREEDVTAADLAEKALADHEAKQLKEIL